MFCFDLKALRAEFLEGGIHITSRPQDQGVDHQTERSQLVFLAVAVLLAQFATLTMEDLTRETMATFMAIPLKQSVATVSRIGNDVEDVIEDVKGFEDASQLSDG